VFHRADAKCTSDTLEKERDGRSTDEIKRRIKSSMTNEIPDKLLLMIPGYARLHTYLNTRMGVLVSVFSQ